jgi:anti-sigma factor RsiW
VSTYIDGELAPRSRARMEGHLGQCAECTRVLDGMRRMLRLLSNWPLAPAPSPADEITAAVLARLHEPRAGARAGAT